MNSLVENHSSELESLCKRYNVIRLDLFGSAATEDGLTADSDLDFLVEFGPFATGGYADSYFGLLESLERLFARSIDLIVPSAIKNPYFLQSVESTKSTVYAA
jgi:predicted nucleotidyltransferase